MAATDRGPSRRRIGMVAAGLGALAGTAARGETSVDFKYLYYGETDNRTKVLNPELYLQQDLGEKSRIGLLLSYDSISGASPTGEVPSVDATASASSSGTIPMAEYTDTRRAASLFYSRRFGSHLPSVDLSYSRESDYLSRGVSLVDSWDLFGGRSTLHLGGGVTRDLIEPGNMTARFDKSSLSTSAGWTQVLGPRDLLDVSLGLTQLDGYLTDPYKRVTVGSISVPEVRPDARSRNTAVFKYGHYFLSRAAIKTTYRYYWDDWSIKAHTLELSLDKRIGQKLIVTPRLRYYRQSAASFFAYEFPTPLEFMSSDYRLSAFWSGLAGLGFRVELSDHLAFEMAGSYLKQTGIDRVMPRSAGALPPLPAARAVVLQEGEDDGGGGPKSLSAADLDTVTATFGFSFKF